MRFVWIASMLLCWALVEYIVCTEGPFTKWHFYGFYAGWVIAALFAGACGFLFSLYHSFVVDAYQALVSVLTALVILSFMSFAGLSQTGATCQSVIIMGLVLVACFGVVPKFVLPFNKQ